MTKTTNFIDGENDQEEQVADMILMPDVDEDENDLFGGKNPASWGTAADDGKDLDS